MTPPKSSNFQNMKLDTVTEFPSQKIYKPKMTWGSSQRSHDCVVLSPFSCASKGDCHIPNLNRPFPASVIKNELTVVNLS